MNPDLDFLPERYTREEHTVQTVTEKNGKFILYFGEYEDIDGDGKGIILETATAERFGIRDKIHPGTKILVETDNYDGGRITNVTIIN